MQWECQNLVEIGEEGVSRSLIYLSRFVLRKSPGLSNVLLSVGKSKEEDRII